MENLFLNFTLPLNYIHFKISKRQQKHEHLEIISPDTDILHFTENLHVIPS